MMLLAACGTNNVPTSSAASATANSSVQDSASISSNSSAVVDSKVSVKNALNLSPDFVSYEVKANDEFTAGKKAIIEVTSEINLSYGFTSEGKQYEHVYLYGNDVAYKASLPKGVTSSNTLEFEVDIPNEELNFVLVYSVQQHVVEDGRSISLSSDADAVLYGVIPSEKYDYIDCYLLPKSASFRISDIAISIGGATAVGLNTLSGCSYEYDLATECYRLTVRPNWQNLTGDVVVSLLGREVSQYTITYKGLSAEAVDMEKIHPPKRLL